MKLSLFVLAICLATVSGQYNFLSCYLSNFPINFWTLSTNPWWDVFASGVTSATACSNLLSWIAYMNHYYAPGSAATNPTCSTACNNGQICVARPTLTSWKCGTNPSGSTFTQVWPALLNEFTANSAPSSAPVVGCYCPFINIPSTTTPSFWLNLQALILLNPVNPAGLFLASFSNATVATECVAISKCPSNQFYNV